MHVDPKRRSCRDRGEHQDHGEQNHLGQDSAPGDGDDGADQQQHGEHLQDDPTDAASSDRLPAGDEREQQQQRSDEPAGKAAHGAEHHEPGGDEQSEGDDGRDTT